MTPELIKEIKQAYATTSLSKRKLARQYKISIYKLEKILLE